MHAQPWSVCSVRDAAASLENKVTAVLDLLGLSDGPGADGIVSQFVMSLHTYVSQIMKYACVH